MRPTKPVQFTAPEPVEQAEVVTPEAEDVPVTDHDELFQSTPDAEEETTEEEATSVEPSTSPFLDAVREATEEATEKSDTEEVTEDVEQEVVVTSIPAARDSKVMEALHETGELGLSKSEVVAKVINYGMFPPDNAESVVYQSLTRLKNAGRIERIGPPRNATWRIL